MKVRLRTIKGNTDLKEGVEGYTTSLPMKGIAFIMGNGSVSAVVSAQIHTPTVTTLLEEFEDGSCVFETNDGNIYALDVLGEDE